MSSALSLIFFIYQWPLYFNGTILAARTGYKVLMETGSVLDACEAAIRSMEIDVIFNAGFGSVLTREGEACAK